DLAPEQRSAALFELGQDYLKAGILDRAEEVFQRLSDGPQAGEARRFLLEIFQQEKDWDKAGAMAKRLETETGKSRARETAHFLCELAATEATHSRPDAARAHLEAALEVHREAGRLEDGLTLLTGYLERYPSLDLLDAVFQSTLESKGAEAAYKLVRDELRRNPTLLGLDRLLEAQIIGAGANPERRRDLELVRNLVHSHT